MRLAGVIGLFAAGCGGVPSGTPVASSPERIEMLVTEGDAIYWLDDRSTVSEVSLAGDVSSLGKAAPCITALGSDGFALYWASCEGEVGKTSLSGGSTTIVPPDGTGTYAQRALVATLGAIYYTADEPSRIMTLATNLLTPPGEFVSDVGHPNLLVSDGAALYWVSYADAGLYRRPLVADAATPSTRLATLAIDPAVPPALAADGQRVFWSDADPQHVHAMRLSDQRTYELAASGVVTGIALDGSHAYWLAGAAVERAPLEGGDTDRLAVAATYPAPFIALTTDLVLWVDTEPACDHTATDCLPRILESVAK